MNNYTNKAKRTSTTGLEYGIKDAGEARINALDMGDTDLAKKYALEIDAFEIELKKRNKGLCIQVV
tara:strand:- start:743 stop:940 length:198 start_codon:yes stop_codon:yes gene_type:complete